MKPMMSRPEPMKREYQGPRVEATINLAGKYGGMYFSTRLMELTVWEHRHAEFKALKEVLQTIGLYGQYRDDCLYSIYKAGVELPPRKEVWPAIYQAIVGYVEAMPPRKGGLKIVDEADVPLMYQNALESWLGAIQ